MKKLSKLLAGMVVFGGLALHAGVAHAQADRTWVSGVGDDANPCSRTAPCKTFAGAISKTAAGGIINCLDPAGFGAITITKSITLDCTYTMGSVLATVSNGINVNGAGIVVHLRGLSIEGSQSGSIGVNIVNAASVHIDQVKIYGFQAGSAAGILFASSGGGQLFVQSSTLSNNGVGTTGGGLVVRPPTSVKVSVTKTDFHGNSNGILAEGIAGVAGINLVATDSTSTGNGNAGVLGRGPVSLMLDRVVASLNGSGLVADGGLAQLLVTNSTIAGNGTAVQLLNGGLGYTYGTNHINANAVDGGLPNGLMQR